MANRIGKPEMVGQVLATTDAKMIRIVALTPAGEQLGSDLQKQLAHSELWYKPQPFTEQVQHAFRQGDRLILICATGIAVRTLAPMLDNKHKDPAVLVLDEAGKFVIPLLSGHEGGANQWAAEIAALLKAQLVLTSANPYLAPVYCVGMGCERGCPQRELEDLFGKCLARAGLSIDRISSINSIDAKHDEMGLIGLCHKLNLPFKTWGAETLRGVEAQLSQRSEVVFNTMGVYGVAESAALVAARQHTNRIAELVLTKQKSAKATCAIARSYPGMPSERDFDQR